MKITQENTGDLTATIRVDVTETDYAAPYQTELNDFRKKAVIPGFRPGKVPMSLVQKKYGMAVLIEEINKIVSKSLNDHITENKLNLLGYPIPNTEKETNNDFAVNKDFVFYFDIAFSPEFQLNVSHDTEIDYFKILVEDSVIDKYIDEQRQRHGTMEEIEVVGEKDMLSVTIRELDAEGNIKENGINNTTSVLPSHLADKEIQKRFFGLKKGDSLDFNPLTATGNPTETATMLNIPKDKASRLDTEFRFTINSISTMIPAGINEELYKKIFPAEEITTEEQFRERIRGIAGKAYDREADELFVYQAMHHLINHTEIPLPDDFLKKWIYINNDGKIDPHDIEHDFPRFREGMKRQLTENQLIRQFPELKVSDDEIRDEIKGYYYTYLPDLVDSDDDDSSRLNALVDKYMKDEKEVERIHDQIYGYRLQKVLKTNLKLNEKPIKYDAFVKLVSEIYSSYNHEHDHSHAHEHEHEHELEDEK